MVTDTKDRVYQYMVDHADGDGFVTTSGRSIAHYLGKPSRTIQGAIQTLERKGKIVMFDHMRFAVVDLADDRDE